MLCIYWLLAHITDSNDKHVELQSVLMNKYLCQGIMPLGSTEQMKKALSDSRKTTSERAIINTGIFAVMK